MLKVTVSIIVIIFLAFLGLSLNGAISPAAAEGGGKALYDAKCATCHGTNGDGHGKLASVFKPPPSNFRSPEFWQGDVNKKITDAVQQGHGAMPATDLNPGQIKAVIDYMSQTFK